MNTWDLFSNNDLILGVVAAAGFVSVLTVLRTALKRTDRRERRLRAMRQGKTT